MDDYINRFRNKVNIENTVSAKISDIIAQSLSRMEVTLERLQKAIPVVFINKDKEGGDESVMYSYTTDAVQIGDYITAFGKSHLVYKEVTNLKRENYIDCWKTVMCNIDFDFNGTKIKAYFSGSLRFDQNEEVRLAQGFGIVSDGTALLVIPSSYNITLNDYFKVNNQGWKVKHIDNITNSGISYITIEEYSIPDMLKKSDTEAQNYTPKKPLYLVSGTTFTIATEGGYFVSNPVVEILERAATFVKFKVPYNISSLTIDTKDAGLVVINTYDVRV